MSSDSALFTPVQVGRMTLRHRVVMAPMTRRRATDAFVPTPLMAAYYAQRAAEPGTLLIAEATSVSPRSAAQPNTPGLFTAEQVAAWRPVTEAVHARGSFIFVQLWMCGRAARPGAVARGAEVVSASDVTIAGQPTAPRPRALTEDEIAQCIDDFTQAARHAVAAGFDGVELHGANGYLLDQFTQAVSNRRTDGWGGSVTARSRFGVAVATAVAAAIGADRVGYRVSPWSRHHGMRGDSTVDLVPQFVDLVRRLRRLRLAYVHAIESRVQANADVAPALRAVAEEEETLDFVAAAWAGDDPDDDDAGLPALPIIYAGGYDAQSARQRVDEHEAAFQRGAGSAALVAFGRTFVSNPDLPARIRDWRPVAAYDRALFYVPGEAHGYTDYPAWDAAVDGTTYAWPVSGGVA